MLTISAVVPAYNAEQYIEDALNSLIRQTYKLTEIIVIDDKSSDTTLQKIEAFSQVSSIPIKIIQHPVNQGVSAARNNGIDAAAGEWILFLDADDVAEAELVQEAVGQLDAVLKATNDNWVVVYPAYCQINAQGEKISAAMRGCQLTSRNSFGCELVRNQIVTPSGVLVNKQAMLAVGKFRLGLEHQIEDWDLWLKLAQSGGGFAYVDKPLVKVRRHTANATKSMSKAMGAEKEVLAFYDMDTIKHAIFARDFEFEINLIDYVNMLYKLELWDLGYAELIKAGNLNSASAFFLQSLYYLKNNNITKARELLEQTVKLNSQNGAAFNNLGVTYALLGDLKLAEEFLNTALTKFPGYIDASFNLSLLKSRVNFKLEGFNITWRELRPVLLNYSE